MLSGASIAKSLLSFGSLGLSSLGLTNDRSSDSAPRPGVNIIDTYGDEDEVNQLYEEFDDFEDTRVDVPTESYVDSSGFDDELASTSSLPPTDSRASSSSAGASQSKSSARRAVGLRHRLQKQTVTNNSPAASIVSDPGTINNTLGENMPVPQPSDKQQDCIQSTIPNEKLNANDGVKNTAPQSARKVPPSFSNSYSWGSSPAPTAAVPAAATTNYAIPPALNQQSQQRCYAPLADGWEEVLLISPSNSKFG